MECCSIFEQIFGILLQDTRDQEDFPLICCVELVNSALALYIFMELKVFHPVPETLAVTQANHDRMHTMSLETDLADDQTLELDVAQHGDDAGCSELEPVDMLEQAQAASCFLKALAHEGRLMILCHLSSGEKSVTELENLLKSRQAAVSQQLARLRLEGIVSSRREGKTIYYALHDPKAARLIGVVYDMFCAQAKT